MHAVDFGQVEGPQLTVADQRLVAELTTRFLNAGCLTSRQVDLTLTEAAQALGFEGGADSGKARRAAKTSLARIRSVTFSSALSSEEKFPTIWGLIDNTDPISPRGGRPKATREAGYVTLNKRLAQLLRDGHVTFLHYPTWDAIAREDAIAGRLWCYLEAERISTGWNYNLFASTKDGAQDERYMPAIADMLLLDWPHRPKIAWRVRRACAVICKFDARYQLEVLKSKTAGMWYLRAHRSRLVPLHTRGPLPQPIRQGWRRAYGPRRPSGKQVAVLDELAARRGATWVGEQLAASASQDDPLRLTMQRDREISAKPCAPPASTRKRGRRSRSRSWPLPRRAWPPSWNGSQKPVLLGTTSPRKPVLLGTKTGTFSDFNRYFQEPNRIQNRGLQSSLYSRLLQSSLAYGEALL